MSLTPLRRNRLVTGPGPDGRGSKPPVRNGLPHMPEKYGMDAAPCAPLVADPAAGTNVCPQAGVAAAAANIANKRKARCLCTPTSRSWFVDDMPAARRPRSPSALLLQRILRGLNCPVYKSPDVVPGCRIRTSSLRKGQLFHAPPVQEPWEAIVSFDTAGLIINSVLLLALLGELLLDGQW